MGWESQNHRRQIEDPRISFARLAYFKVLAPGDQRGKDAGHAAGDAELGFELGSRILPLTLSR